MICSICVLLLRREKKLKNLLIFQTGSWKFGKMVNDNHILVAQVIWMYKAYRKWITCGNSPRKNEIEIYDDAVLRYRAHCQYCYFRALTTFTNGKSSSSLLSCSLSLTHINEKSSKCFGWHMFSKYILQIKQICHKFVFFSFLVYLNDSFWYWNNENIHIDSILYLMIHMNSIWFHIYLLWLYFKTALKIIWNI